MNVDTVLKIMDITIAAASGGLEAKARYDRLRSQLNQFSFEKRDPTSEEWTEMTADTESIHERIQKA